MNSIGERLIYARKFRGFTQAQLSEASYVTRGVIANIETGRFSAQTVALVALSNALNVNKEWLIDGIGPMEPDNERAKILDELYTVCAGLTEAQQLYLLDQVRIMRKHNVLQMENEPPEKPETKALIDIIQDAEDRKPTVPPGTGRNQNREI